MLLNAKKRRKKNEAEFTPRVFPSESPSNNPFWDTQNSTKLKKFANAYDIDYKGFADERESKISRYRDVSLIS